MGWVGRWVQEGQGTSQRYLQHRYERDGLVQGGVEETIKKSYWGEKEEVEEVLESS